MTALNFGFTSWPSSRASLIACLLDRMDESSWSADISVKFLKTTTEKRVYQRGLTQSECGSCAYFAACWLLSLSPWRMRFALPYSETVRLLKGKWVRFWDSKRYLPFPDYDEKKHKQTVSSANSYVFDWVNALPQVVFF